MIDGNIRDVTTEEGLCLSKDEMLSTEPCLDSQLGEDAKLESSSSRSSS